MLYYKHLNNRKNRIGNDGKIHEEPDYEENIYLNLKNISGNAYFDNGYNIMSALDHEIYHLMDRKANPERFYNDKIKDNGRHELRAIRYQENQDYYDKTSDRWQENMFEYKKDNSKKDTEWFLYNKKNRR